MKGGFYGKNNFTADFLFTLANTIAGNNKIVQVSKNFPAVEKTITVFRTGAPKIEKPR